MSYIIKTLNPLHKSNPEQEKLQVQRCQLNCIEYGHKKGKRQGKLFKPISQPSTTHNAHAYHDHPGCQQKGKGNRQKSESF